MFLATNNNNETIIAQCTPQGSGAIALLRLSGTHALSVATQISSLASKQKIDALPTHTIHYGWVVDKQGNHIDQVMFLIMHGPKTFTGQDTIEITCHNNPFIVQAIIEQAIAAGARLADNGEFTRRAVLNDKIDLVQAEAINELIHANTQMALKKSLAQLEGSFSFWITGIEKKLTTALAFSEASFEFIDEEMSFDKQIQEIINSALQTIATIKKTFDQQQQIRQGIRIAIIGSVNAGKSSLFNALLGKNRAIVTSIAGTTRDVIEAGVYRTHNYWTLIDTAGLRQSENIIEQEGISRSFEQAQLADIILLVFDGSRPVTPQEKEVYVTINQKYAHKIIFVRNKADLPNNTQNPLPDQPEIAASSKDNTNIQLIEERIDQKIAELLSNAEAPFLLNKRQFNLLMAIERELHAIAGMIDGQETQHELLSYHLIDAIKNISELTGKTVSENGMDAVFREFCVGK